MPFLLVVHPDDAKAAALLGALRERQDVLDGWSVPTLDHARRELSGVSSFAAVLVAPGLKRLSLASFAKTASAKTPAVRLLLIDEEHDGYTTLPGVSPAQVIEQVLAMLGVVRSATVDAPTVGSLGVSGAAFFERVAWPGAPQPLLRATAVTGPTFDASTWSRAQRAGLVSGPGLAPTLESFWDDPRPHVLQQLPPGVSLWRLRRQRTGWDVPVALSIARGLCEGLVTLHEAGFSGGTLRGPECWLTDEGEVLLLGHALLQLPYHHSEYYGLPEEAPPEEYGQQIAPQPQGDAFRLGVLIMLLAVDRSAVRELRPAEYLERQWRPDLGPWRSTFGPAVCRALEILLAPFEVDRPRGALLRDVLDEVAPKNWPQVLRDAVKWSKAAPYFG